MSEPQDPDNLVFFKRKPKIVGKGVMQCKVCKNQAWTIEMARTSTSRDIVVSVQCTVCSNVVEIDRSPL